MNVTRAVSGALFQRYRRPSGHRRRDPGRRLVGHRVIVGAARTRVSASWMVVAASAVEVLARSSSASC